MLSISASVPPMTALPCNGGRPDVTNLATLRSEVLKFVK